MSHTRAGTARRHGKACLGLGATRHQQRTLETLCVLGSDGHVLEDGPVRRKLGDIDWHGVWVGCCGAWNGLDGSAAKRDEARKTDAKNSLRRVPGDS